MFLLGGNNFFQPRCFFCKFLFLPKCGAEGAAGNLFDRFIFIFLTNARAPPSLFFKQNFLFFLSFFSVLLFMALVEPHFRDQKIKTFSFSFFFRFFFFFVFSNLRFFYPAPETIYPLISGGPGPKLQVA